MSKITGTSQKFLKKLSIAGAILLVLGVLISLIFGYIVLGRHVVPLGLGEVLEDVDVSKPYFVANFPAIAQTPSYSGRSTHTFYIPKYFVEFGSVVVERGRIKKLPIEYELPSKLSLQTLRQMGTSEYEEVKKTTLGEFRTDLMGERAGGITEDLMRRVQGYYAGLQWQKPDDTIIRDGEFAGLVRYSQVTCFDHRMLTATPSVDLKASAIHFYQQQYKDAMVNRPPDDPVTKPLCRVNRNRSEFFTPMEFTPLMEQVHIHCSEYDCNAYVNVTNEWGTEVRFAREKLPRWREVAQGTRELIHSFMIKPNEALRTSS